MEQLVTSKLAAAIADIPIPRRMRKLPISEKGFPIPAFVAWMALKEDRYLPAGTYGARRDFRIIDPSYLAKCFRFSRCWLCDEPLGRYRVFAIGPMCVVNRVTMEPPSHRDCAEYAVKACPFLVNPRMVRNEKEMPIEKHAPGLMIARNPGVTALYQTTDYRRFNAGGGELLCRLGIPESIQWYANGQLANRRQVLTSIDTGYPLLVEQARKDGPEALTELRRMRTEAMAWVPEH